MKGCNAHNREDTVCLKIVRVSISVDGQELLLRYALALSKVSTRVYKSIFF